VNAVLALGIVVVFGFLGALASDPLYDAAARSICSTYAADRGLELIEARGSPEGRLAFASFPNYSCDFAGPDGATIVVDENDDLIEPTWVYRASASRDGSRGCCVSRPASVCRGAWACCGATDRRASARPRNVTSRPSRR
jgi:hypothetical protein